MNITPEIIVEVKDAIKRRDTESIASCIGLDVDVVESVFFGFHPDPGRITTAEHWEFLDWFLAGDREVVLVLQRCLSAAAEGKIESTDTKTMGDIAADFGLDIPVVMKTLEEEYAAYLKEIDITTSWREFLEITTKNRKMEALTSRLQSWYEEILEEYDLDLFTELEKRFPELKG